MPDNAIALTSAAALRQNVYRGAQKMRNERMLTKALPARIVRRIGQVWHYCQDLWRYPVIPKGRYVAQHVVHERYVPTASFVNPPGRQTRWLGLRTVNTAARTPRISQEAYN